MTVKELIDIFCNILILLTTKLVKTTLLSG